MRLTQTLDPLNLLSVSDFNGIKKTSKVHLQDLRQVISHPEKIQSIKIKKPPKNNQNKLISIMENLKTIEYLENIHKDQTNIIYLYTKKGSHIYKQ